MNETTKYRPDYGTLPKQGVVDIDDYKKMRNCIPPLTPLTNYDDLLMVLACRLGQELFLRAGPEVSFIILIFIG